MKIKSYNFGHFNLSPSIRKEKFEEKGRENVRESAIEKEKSKIYWREN